MRFGDSLIRDEDPSESSDPRNAKMIESPIGVLDYATAEEFDVADSSRDIYKCFLRLMSY